MMPWWAAEFSTLRPALKHRAAITLRFDPSLAEDVVSGASSELAERFKQDASAFPTSWFGNQVPVAAEAVLFRRLATQVVRRRSLDELRAHYKRTALVRQVAGWPDVAAPPDRIAAARMLLRKLARAIDALSAPERELLLREDTADRAMSNRERQQLYRIRRRLALALGKSNDQG